MNSKDIGTLGEHIAIVQLLTLGVEVSRPLGDNSRYDLILDVEGVLITCQVKSTSSSTEELAEFWLSSSQAHRGKTRVRYDVDCFLLVDVPKNLVFILPNSAKSTIKLRYKNLTSSSNNYEDYLLTLSKLNEIL